MTEWVTPKDVIKIAQCNEHKAREIIKKINQENLEQGYLVPNMFKVPKQQLLKRLGLKEQNT